MQLFNPKRNIELREKRKSLNDRSLSLFNESSIKEIGFEDQELGEQRENFRKSKKKRMKNS